MSAERRAHSHDHRYYGVMMAIVTANEDPDKLGRVKVNFPWFDGGSSESVWCRMSQVYAGGSSGAYGTVFVPEVGDEVLVAFEHGDMRIPYVLGGLYNGTDKPPEERSSSKDVKMIRTKAGHEIVLEDTSGAQAIRLTTAGGRALELDDDNQKVSITTTSGGPSVTLDDAQGKITISDGSGSEVVVDASGVTVKGQMIKLQGSSIELGDGASEPLVLGTTFLSWLMSHTHNVTMVGAPSGPPVPPPVGILSTTVRTK